MQVAVHNRGPEEATIHVLPQLWFLQYLAVLPVTVRLMRMPNASNHFSALDVEQRSRDAHWLDRANKVLSLYRVCGIRNL